MRTLARHAQRAATAPSERSPPAAPLDARLIGLLSTYRRIYYASGERKRVRRIVASSRRVPVAVLIAAVSACSPAAAGHPHLKQVPLADVGLPCSGHTADGWPAGEASLGPSCGIALDQAGNVLVSDSASMSMVRSLATTAFAC